MLNQLMESMTAAIRQMKEWSDREIQLFHHNDSDGLSSGAILTRAFERQNYSVKRFCLEKPYPAVLRKVFDQKNKCIVFTDFAGRIAPIISELNRGRNLTLILDHHVAEPATDPMVHNLDPDLYGLKGDRDITASTTCYLFARLMDPDNQDLAYIAGIGAVGDGFFVDGRLVDQNREVVLEAVRQGMMEIRDIENGEQYFIKSNGEMIPCEALGADLDTLGAAGYYQHGPDMGIRVCLEGISQDSKKMVEELKTIQTRRFEDQVSKLKQGALNQTTHIQWFHVKDRFSPMGVKMIGAFCDVYKDTDLFDPRRYIAGFQIIPNEIPGFGSISFNEVKISMRVSAYMADEIRSGRCLGLDVLLPEATAKVGGFSDACHTLTAATTVAIGREEDLIEEMESILRSA
jgi:single-stranded-DNA-specific exonuclease